MLTCIVSGHLRDADHNIAVGDISHPYESLLNDPLALDLDVGHRGPRSQQKRRGSRATVLLLLT